MGRPAAPFPSLNTNDPSRSALKQAAERHFKSSAPSSVDPTYWLPPKDPIELSTATECELLDRIDESVDFVLECLGPNASVVTNWKVKARRNGMAFYEDHTLQECKQAESTQIRYCCVAQSIASVEDLMAIFVATDNATLKKNARIMHSKVVDTRLISVLRTPTAENPFASTFVKYTRVSSGLWHRDRDMCAVVATNFMEMPDGSTMGYCLWDSVDINECPDLTIAQGIQRTRMVRSGYIIRNTGQPNAKTRILYFSGVNDDANETHQGSSGRRASVSQHVTSSTAFHALDQIGGNLERICAHFLRKPLDVYQFVARSDWSSLTQARYCCSCHHAFSILSRRYNCTACGDVMCRACCRKEEVDLPGVGLKKMRICTFCVRGMDETFRLSRASMAPRSTGTGRGTGTFCRMSGTSSSGGSEEYEYRMDRGTALKTARW